MSIIAYTRYRRDGSEERHLATVFPPENRPRRSTLRDRIARLHLDAINPDLASAFDALQSKTRDEVYIGVDLSNADDFTVVWEMRV